MKSEEAKKFMSIILDLYKRGIKNNSSNKGNASEAIEFINIIFNFYNNSKENQTLYRENDKVPKSIIETYYSYISIVDYGSILDRFKEKYIENEAAFEENEKCEREGLALMYDYIKEFDNYDKLDIYIICTLNRLLFSKCPYPEFGGNFRKHQVFLPEDGIEVPEADMIITRLQKLYNELKEYLASIKDSDKINVIGHIKYCIQINCELIKIQPFSDGNKRTARGFLNLLFKRAGLPPVYIKSEEKTIYWNAMKKAIRENEYDEIFTFYYYKICDSIYELDVKPHKEEISERKNIK